MTDLVALTSKLGKIVIKVSRVHGKEPNENYKGGRIESVNAMPEKALKGEALSHSTGWGIILLLRIKTDTSSVLELVRC